MLVVFLELTLYNFKDFVYYNQPQYGATNLYNCICQQTTKTSIQSHLYSLFVLWNMAA